MLKCTCLACCLGPLLVVAPAWAQPEGYRELIHAAVEHFDAGRWQEARASFQAAHQMFPNARTHHALGVCDFELQHYARALEELQSALQDSRLPLTVQMRRDAEAMSEEARSYLGRVQLRDPRSVENIVVDGVVQVSDPHGMLVLDPGAHRLVITVEGGRKIRWEVMVYRGQLVELNLSIPDRSWPPPASAPAFERAGPARSSLLAVAPALGAIFFGTTAVSLALGASAARSEYRDKLQQGMPPDRDLERSADRLDTWTGFSIMASSLSAVAAIALLITAEDPARPATTRLRIGSTPGAASMNITF